MAAHISCQSRLMPMSMLGSANRHPKFRCQFPGLSIRPIGKLKESERSGFFVDGHVPLLPYTPQESYDRHQAINEMPTIVLENSFMRATVYPRYGGRLASLYDKRAGRELLYDNPVFQPANLAIRNAWFSGGVEWNGPLYGHNLLTCSDVYVASVDTLQGQAVRIYEFDRVLETAWQVDLSLDEFYPRLWIHIKIFNLNDHDVDYYWWTNIAVPQTRETRVFANDVGRCVRHTPRQFVYGMDYPFSLGFDGSYPERYQASDSIFFDLQENQMPWIAFVDGRGQGLIHTSTRQLCGRKMFVWGSGTGGRRWMDFLSRPGQGDYLEIQGGLCPTQLQTRPMKPGVGFEWTECISGIQLDSAQVHHRDYSRAKKTIESCLTPLGGESLVLDQHRYLSTMASQPVTQNLWKGSAWGAIYEKAAKRPIASSMTFDAPMREGEKPWARLVHGDCFDDGDAIGDWVRSERWISLLSQHIHAGQGGWKHYLHMGVCRLEQNRFNEAREAFFQSNIRKSNEYAWRNLGVLELQQGHIAQAQEAYCRAMEIAGPDIELALEYCRLLWDHHLIDQARTFIETLPPPIYRHERIQILVAQLALERNDMAIVNRILHQSFCSIRESETTLSDLWYSVQFHEESLRLGHALSESEQKQYRIDHDPPAGIDFRMNLEHEDPFVDG